MDRLRAVRAAADASVLPAFISARADVFLKAATDAEQAGLLDEAIARAAAYAEAGADGFFAPRLTDTTLIRTLCEKVALPVNVMIADPRSNGDLAACGASGIRFGPNPYFGPSAVQEREAGACV